MTFGENLKSLREARGLTQAELGAAIGISGAHNGEVRIQHWEHNRQQPNIAQIIALKNTLQVTYDELLEP